MAKRETSRRVKPQRGGGPLIAIVGGADSTRTDYEPPVMHHDIARQAARALGAELAAQGCRIIVYSTEPSFIESDVVQGFLQGAPAGGQELIQVRFPYGAETGRFGETAAQEKLFEYLPDTDRSWEAGFYRSLADADGVLLLGGGRSTLIVGHVAIAQRIPISALATFGGAARTIWHSLRPEKDLVSEVEWRAMARPEWRREYAAEIVAGLRSHAMRRREAKARNEDAEQQKTLLTTWRAVLSGVLFVAAFGMAAGGNSLLPGTFWFEFLLLLVGPCAGAASALVRTIASAEPSDSSILATLAQGFGAGTAAALLFLLAQYSTAGKGSEIQPVALFFALAIGILAGFTFDRVLRRMTQAEIPLPIPRRGGS
jgi:hypothetical protein